MAKGFKKGGGGSNPFNFKIVAYATEELLKAAMPKANTLGVITDKKITGYHFSPTQPTKMVEGEVWFCIGTSSPIAFNALKKNSIMVYPLSAKQYVSGALVDVVTKSYQGGKWVEWTKYTYLFKSGSGAQVVFGHTNESQATVTETAECVTITATQPTYGSCAWLCEDKVSLDKAKNLVFHAKCNPFDMGSDENYTAYFYVLTETVKAGELFGFETIAVARIECGVDSEARDYIIPVDGLTGSYYIGTAGCHKDTVIYDVYYTE